MIFAQLSGAISLNDVCDNLRIHQGLLATIRGALLPSRNGLSHANKVRNADMAEALFWSTLEHFEEQRVWLSSGLLCRLENKWLSRDLGGEARPARLVPTGFCGLPRGAGRTSLESHAEIVRKSFGLSILTRRVRFWRSPCFSIV